MFILGEDLTVNWKIVTDPNNVIPLSYFDVRISRPDPTHTNHFESVYLDTQDSASLESFIISYTFTPDVEGVWRVVLTKGSAEEHTVLMEHNLTIHKPDTHVYQQVLTKPSSTELFSNVNNTSLQEAQPND